MEEEEEEDTVDLEELGVEGEVEEQEELSPL